MVSSTGRSATRTRENTQREGGAEGDGSGYCRDVISVDHPLGLGSASPRRRDFLATLGLPLKVIPADVDEQRRAGERPDAFLERIVRDKLAQVAALEAAKSMGALLVADTIVVLGDAILGKPKTRMTRAPRSSAFRAPLTRC